MNTRQWFYSGVAVCLNIPMFVYAQQGLVPCGRAGQADCQTCHVVQLVSGVNAWLVGILSIVAAILFVIAGFRLVTSNGNSSVLQDAKNMIINAAIGFVIVLAAWLLLDLFMKSLLSDTEQGLGPWNEIACTDQPVATTEPRKLDIEILDAAALTQAIGYVDPSLAPEAYSAGDCSVANLQANGFTAQQAQVMSCIAQPESGCDNNADASNNGLGSTARGVFQIVYGYSDKCHSLRLPECTAANGGVPLNCGKSDDTPGSACNRAASNFTCNAAAARCLLNGAPGVKPGFQHWLADSRASTQASCVARYAG